jgi:hypothetical protein
MDPSTILMEHYLTVTFGNALKDPIDTIQSLLAWGSENTIRLLDEPAFVSAFVQNLTPWKKQQVFTSALINSDTAILRKLSTIPEMWKFEESVFCPIIDAVIGQIGYRFSDGLVPEEIENQRDQNFELMMTLPGFLSSVGRERSLAVRGILPRLFTERAFQRALQIIQLPGITREIWGETVRELERCQNLPRDSADPSRVKRLSEIVADLASNITD